jgi:hypothetical protein
MITIQIATQGLAPGGKPLQIGTQGLLAVAVAPEEEDREEPGGFLIPVFFRPPPKDRRDCKIEVEGITLHLTATTANVAAGMPTTEELDAEDDAAWIEHIRRMEAEAAEDAEEEIQFQVWEHFEEIREAEKIKAEEARAFRKNVASIARGLRKGPRIDLVGISAALVGFAQENFELRERLEALEAEAASAKKKAAKPARTGTEKMRGPHSREVGRGDVETCFSMDALRASREVAWRAFMRGEISPDPSFGGGADEIEFPGGVNRAVRGFHSIPNTPGIR